MSATLLKFLLFFVACLAFSFLAYKILLRFIKTLGVKNREAIRFKQDVKPTIGGIVFYITFLISIFCSAIIFDQFSLFKYQYSGILAAVSIAFIMGLADDAYNTIPWLKLATQIICGLILVFTGNNIHLFSSLIFNNFLTVFWVVLLMNSLNMLDNMDGISAAVCLFISIALLFFIYLNSTIVPLLFTILIGAVASLITFLYFNKPEAKIYMGDNGSQFLGVLIAILSIHFVWNYNLPLSYTPIYRNLSFLALLFVVPLTDTTTVSINRIRQGRSPMKGGRDHTTHFLFYRGFSNRQVLAIFSGLTILSGIILIALSCIKSWKIIYTVIAFVYCLIIFLLLFLPTQKKKK